jgi:uncharacterized membrane protein YjjP (DUF1212 family)
MEAALQTMTKPPLTHDDLREAIDLSLWAGQLLLQAGAETALVESSVHHIGTGLGCDWLDVFASPNAITITASSGGEFRTKTRRVVSAPVNMTIVYKIAHMEERLAEQGGLTRETVRADLAYIGSQKKAYHPLTVVIMVGLACAAFSRLFEGDWGAFALTWAAASSAMLVRQQLALRYFNPFLITIITAFVAGLVASVGIRLGMTETPRSALAAAVLLLVPGVYFINAAQDLIKGYTVMGVARGVVGALLSFAIALGLLTAITLLGVQGL